MSTQPIAPLIRYQYDALDRLVCDSRSDTAKRQRFYCESRLTTEIEVGEQLSFFQQGDLLLAQQQQRGDGVKSTLLATDLQRSVLNSLQAKSQQTIVYSPYGHRLCESGLSSLLGFNGQRPEPVTGHYLLGNGYRAFNPVLMRFNRPDNLSPFGEGDLNAYAYCAGDPINAVDPTGHFISAIRATLLSWKKGNTYKPVKDFTRISESAAVFIDRYKGGTRITIDGHGSTEGFQWGSNKKLGPVELYENLKNRGLKLEKYDSVRLMMCHSADVYIDASNPLGVPFAQIFADAAGRPVKAYKGEVIASPSARRRLRQLNNGQTSRLTEYFAVYKSDESLKPYGPDAQYVPVHFRPRSVRD